MHAPCCRKVYTNRPGGCESAFDGDWLARQAHRIMLLPLKDDNPLRIIPFQAVTVAIMAVCIAVFLWQENLPQREAMGFTLSYGTIPAVLFDAKTLSPALWRLPAEATVISSMFLHGGWMHLIGNMLFLWVFGDNIEDSMGHIRFLVFYLLCGALATLAFAVSQPLSQSPLIGASGAIAGVLGAYLVLHPRVKVLVLVFMRVPLRLPAYVVLAFWFGFQIFSVYTHPESQTAWWAHIGGFVAGAILIIPFRYKHIPLFDKGIRH